MKDLEQLRGEIDGIDRQLVDLFEQRMAVVHQIGQYKKDHGLPVFDPERERKVLSSKTALLTRPELAEALQAWFRTLMTVSKDLERKLGLGMPQAGVKDVVAYYGIPGAYSHDAMRQAFPVAQELPCEQFSQVFQAVVTEEAAYGIVPAENTTTGTIADVYDLMVEYPILIAGEVVVPVHHCLLGLPGARLEDVRQVYSHEQGLEQCRSFLEQHPHWEPCLYGNTALSARYVKDCGDITKAAIASQHAGRTYGLQVLASDIQKVAANSTRFFVITQQNRLAPQEGEKLSLTFTLQHRQGALYQALGVFAGLDCNLTRIESRPILGENFCYRFFVDIEGVFRWEKVMAILEQLGPYTESCRLLGLYHKVVADHA